MATYEETMALSKKLAAAGDKENAKRLAEIALKMVRGGKPAEKQPEPAQSGFDRFKSNWLPDDNPDSHNRGEKLAAMINKAGEAMTVGLIGDEADARVKSWLGGGTYEEELAKNRKQEEVLSRDHPGAAIGSEIAGGVLGAFAPGGQIGTLSRGAGFGAKVAASAGAGAGMGATYGFMEGEGRDDRLSEGLTGGLLGGLTGAAAPVVGAGVQKVADDVVQSSFLRSLTRPAMAGAPSTADLKATGRALYKEVDDAGVQIKPEAFSRLTGEITDYLRANGLDELPGPGSLTPKSARVVEIARQMDGQLRASADAGQNPGLLFSSLDQLRRHASTAAMNMAPDGATDRALGAMTIEVLDQFVDGLGDRADGILTGDFAALKTALPKARETWKRMSKSQLLDDAIEQSETYLSGQASGLRNQFARILRNKKLAKKFTDVEKAAMKRVAQGSLPETLVHYMGSGLGMMGTMGGGAAAGLAGGPVGALLGGAAGTAAASGARKASGAIAMRNANAARALVANGGGQALPAVAGMLPAPAGSIPIASDAVRGVSEGLLRRLSALQAN